MTPIELVVAPDEGATLPIGDQGPAFEALLGTDGQRHGFSSFAGRDVLVLIFSSNRCPTAKAYGERLNVLQREYGTRGVQLVALNSVDPTLYPDESFAQMAVRAEEDGYTFPYLVDDGQRAAKAYGARCTFHVFVLDRERRLRYEGRFDDSRIATRVTSHDLRYALEDVLGGREVRVPTTRPFGCSLDFT